MIGYDPASGFLECIPSFEIGIDHFQHMECKSKMEIVPLAVFPVIGVIGAQAGLGIF
jgi:hypothetical protein